MRTNYSGTSQFDSLTLELVALFAGVPRSVAAGISAGVALVDIAHFAIDGASNGVSESTELSLNSIALALRAGCAGGLLNFKSSDGAIEFHKIRNDIQKHGLRGWST